MKKVKRTLSLRMQMMLIVLLCWLLPVLMVLSVMGWYLSDSVGQRAEQTLSEQFRVNLKMCADRVNSAVEASRLASYDPTIRDAWNDYCRSRNYAALYRSSRTFLTRQYQPDSRFRYSVLWFPGEEMTLTTVNSGTVFQQAERWWEEDFTAVKELAENLDTAVGFLERDGRVYLVRNLVDPTYHTYGVLALALNLSYYFDDLAALSWASDISVRLGTADDLILRGEGTAEESRGVIRQAVPGSGYQLSAVAVLDYGVLLSQVQSYRYILLGMVLLLIPMLLFTFWFLRRKVSRPVEVLMAGSGRIEQGELGYQLDYKANSREFQYLIESFNHMSGQLHHQFDRLYQEELALRDAQIKALQSHINPHFLNNTLEIINWEARMSGDAKVSKMIESLATVLDAALDRKKSPEVLLAEEMAYVNAYLYIIDQRFGKRLHVTIDLPEELMAYKVPRLILQPVIENAVEHGIGPGGNGHVALRGWREDKFLILEVENDGGMSPKDEMHIARLLSPDYDASKESSGNIGIANVNLRLRILYGADCGLTITRGEGSLVTARMTIALAPEGLEQA